MKDVGWRGVLLRVERSSLPWRVLIGCVIVVFWMIAILLLVYYRKIIAVSWNSVAEHSVRLVKDKETFFQWCRGTFQVAVIFAAPVIGFLIAVIGSLQILAFTCEDDSDPYGGG